jgi:cyclohexadieny/prephenate dehydrogenase
LSKKLPDIAIIAPGLLGASLGAASRKFNVCGKIHVWARRPETRVLCSALNWCDVVHDNIGDAVKDADLVWVCSPVSAIARLIHQLTPWLKPGAVISDVGSTKRKLVAQCEQAIGNHGVFVGSHPMAGSEKSGLDHARADLYKGKACFVTPGKDTPESAIAIVETYWKAIGMRVTRMTPDEHDRIVGYISHLPHLVASSLSCMLCEKGGDHWKSFVGTGLLDTTRVASGNVEMWKDIIDHNREEILPALGSMIAALEHLRTHIENGRQDALMEVLAKGKHFRDSIDFREES